MYSTIYMMTNCEQRCDRKGLAAMSGYNKRSTSFGMMGRYSGGSDRRWYLKDEKKLWGESFRRK